MIIEYKGYITIPRFDEDEGCYSGGVLNITRDGAHYQAASLEEAEREFRASVEEYLAFCREEGRTPEAPGPVALRISPELYEKLLAAAGTEEDRKSVV